MGKVRKERRKKKTMKEYKKYIRNKGRMEKGKKVMK